jgi:hypothetical protein
MFCVLAVFVFVMEFLPFYGLAMAGSFMRRKHPHLGPIHLLVLRIYHLLE